MKEETEFLTRSKTASRLHRLHVEKEGGRCSFIPNRMYEACRVELGNNLKKDEGKEHCPNLKSLVPGETRQWLWLWLRLRRAIA